MKKKIPKERVIYSNYDLSESYPDDYMEECLIANGFENDEITDNLMWKYRYYYNEDDWYEVKEQFKDFFSNGKYIAFGDVGLWHGVYPCGIVFDDFESFLYKAKKDCDYWEFYDENGHFHLTCSHHDGTCHFEIKEMTERGIQYLENWENNYDDKRTEKYIHKQIIHKYSRLPRYAEKVFGCKPVEWEPITKGKLIDVLNNQAKSFYS